MRPSYVEALRKFSENGRVQETLEPGLLTGILKEKGIITETEADQILARSSRLQRQQGLLIDLIPKREDDAFQTLLEVMDSEQLHWAREMLERMHEKEQKKSHKKQETPVDS